MTDRFRPLVQSGDPRPAGAVPVAGGPLWFAFAERLGRGCAPVIVAASELPAPVREAIAAPRPPLAGWPEDRPALMGIVNVTPDSFSDGGRFVAPETAARHVEALVRAGADILDIGGESTRPGAAAVAADEEWRRIAPVIAVAIRLGRPVSVDTRKAEVAARALEAGAAMVNDVSAMTYDPGMAAIVADADVPVCLMHAQGDPATMQQDPTYDDVLHEVFDWLAERVAAAEAAGIPRGRIVVDPGIGFGKTVAHNLALIRGLSLFHGLGCRVLLGASRKAFIGKVGQAPATDDRTPGSIAVALAGAAQGVQALRVHDIAETAQALRLWTAASLGADR